MGARWTSVVAFRYRTRSTELDLVLAIVPAAASTEPDFFSVESLIAIRDHLLPGLLSMRFAFAICAVAVPLMVVLSRRLVVMPLPTWRHPHSRPMPRPGGLCMSARSASS